MQQILNRLTDSIMALLFGVFRRTGGSQPLPPPPPLPPGVPPTPGPILPPPPVQPPVVTDLYKRLVDFVNHYQLKFVDIDHFAGAQCVDVQLAWCDWLRVPHFPGVPGAGWHAGMYIPGWAWLANSPNNIPQPGDVVIWGRSPTLPWGHEGVYLRGDVMHLITFDQNWPYNSPCHEQGHTYGGVAGWFRPLVWH